MRIALLTDGIYPYVMGGMQKHSFYLTKYLALNKVEVDLYHTGMDLNSDTVLNCFSEEERKYIHSVYIPFPKLDSFPGHYLRESAEYSKRIFEVLQKLDKKVDFIYAQGFSGWEFIKRKLEGHFFPPIAVHFHGLEVFQKTANLKSLLEQRLLRKPILFNLKNADYVFSLGGKLNDILLTQGISKRKIISIPLGIDSLWINEHIAKRDNEKKKFVFVGRYERRKGVQELNQVLSKMIGQHDFEFDFIGPLPEKMKLKSSKIVYHGSLTDTEKIKNILNNSDVLVCPSHSEGMPNVIVEAMACGMAVIATDVGAISILVGDKTGCLIEKPDASLLESTMIKFVKMNRLELYEKRLNARDLIKTNFTWDKIAAQTVNVLSDIVKKV